MGTRPVWLASLFLVCSAIVSAQTTPGTDPQTYRSGIDLVTVDVSVITRDGEPLASLNRDDFTVLVDGKPRPIVSITLMIREGVPSLPVSTEQSGISVASGLNRGRRYVLVIDQDHIPIGEGQQMLSAAMRFIDDLVPEDRVAVWTLPHSSGALRFDDDRAVIRQRVGRAVGTYRPVQRGWMIGRDEAITAYQERIAPAGVEITDSPTGLGIGSVVDTGRQTALQAIIARECFRQLTSCPKDVETQVYETALDAMDRARTSFVALGQLIEALKGVPGPKDLVYLTTGPVNAIENYALLTSLGEQARGARVTVHALQIHDPTYRATAGQMRPVPEETVQTNSAAYALAGMTGGLALTPASGHVGFERLSKELAASYVLVFETTDTDKDGKSHRIDVKVRDRGWGTAVRARPSFVVEIRGDAPGAQPDTIRAAAPAPAPAAAVVVSAAPSGPVGTEPDAIAERLAAYAERLEREAGTLVAEERYVQIVQPWKHDPAAPEKEPALQWSDAGDPTTVRAPLLARRQLVSDVLLWQPATEQWMAYRDVSAVNGQPVRDAGDRIQRLFLSQEPDKAAQFLRISTEGSRHQLGDLKRDFNLPTVTLSLLRRLNQWRFDFKRQRDETIDGRSCRVLSYRERESPSLIATRSNGDVFTYGRIWIDKADGTIRRTEFRFDRGKGVGGFKSFVRVDYGPVDGFDILIPVRMWEWHEGVNQLGQVGTEPTGVQGLATYSNIRRLERAAQEPVK